MFAEAAVGCSSGALFLGGRSQKRLKCLGTLRASASAIKDGWAWPLLVPDQPIKVSGAVWRCCPAVCPRLLGASGYQLWAAGPGKAWVVAVCLAQLSDEQKTFWKLP